MCTSIWIDGENAPIESLGEMVKRFGWENVPWRDPKAKALYHFEPLSKVGDYCLCGVDLPKAAEWLGYASERDVDGDPMRWIWRKNDADNQG